MEILLSPHLHESLSEIMRTSYNIYSSVGFIGFCVIYNNQKAIQAHLLLFDTALPKNGDDCSQRPEIDKNYPLNTSDFHILKDLMSSAISSYSKKETYVAHNANAIYNID